ncbi:hypothetical protein JY651_47590 [Pyxidicoccus parkwayensis]|jgi:hypothetical protein|uniref:Lipoprotein n=1 Tax=Pyxidicoccus parkwayensis TaxID=2813578 RepID=A0ABX7P1T6_9BACT|nr:hypothetical protein [Pyxidicoccus parkwaysis]QSQ22688.1 hypothetical protein JY651_47590 [Pyxidicoccus parkwaysis]
MTLRTLTLTTVLAFGSLLAGCANDADSICEKRHSCYDGNLDTGKCTDDIDAWVGDQDERKARVEACARCIDDRSCTEVFESCIDDCFDIP